MRSVKPTNHASPLFSVVPVLPATNDPSARPARLPVPRVTTVCMIPTAVWAVVLSSTRRRRSRLTASVRLGCPRRSSVATSRMPTGPARLAPSVPDTRRPSAANVSYACAMSSGVTPCRRPPSVIARFDDTGVRMPIRRARRATFLVPTLMPTAANTELSDAVSAPARVFVPE
jgi:hypothetical protein